MGFAEFIIGPARGRTRRRLNPSHGPRSAQIKTGRKSRPVLLATTSWRLLFLLREAAQGAVQVPTASRTHFLVKLDFAAPASFFSDAWDVQVVVASL